MFSRRVQTLTQHTGFAGDSAAARPSPRARHRSRSPGVKVFGQRSGQCGLSGARSAAHQDQPDRRRRADGPGRSRGGGVRRRQLRGTLGVAERSRPWRAPRRGRRCRSAATTPVRRRRPVGVAAQEVLGEISLSQVLQVHRQERGVVDGVDVAQSVVELQAVQQGRPVGRQKMSSANRSAWPSTIRRSAIRRSNNAARPARIDLPAASISATICRIQARHRHPGRA